MQNLSCILINDKNQRIINGVIFLCLLVWILAKLRYVHLASDIMVHYKYNVLKIIALTYLTQSIINRNWLNFTIKAIYVSLTIYVLYTYIYSFFDTNDFVMQKEYGVLIKSAWTLLKVFLLCSFIWFTNKIQPMNTAHNTN